MVNAQDRLDALEVALGNETKEREFYLANAERIRNPVGKTMFRKIAAEEVEHYRRLKKLHEKWVQHEQWPETVPLTVRNTEVGNVLSEVIRKMGESAPGDSNDLKAVRIAIDFEQKGAAHYEKLRDMVSDPKEKQFFDLLSKIEHEHYLSLKETEEFFIDPADWYRREEHHSIDGG
jgi:rubrerythrin